MTREALLRLVQAWANDDPPPVGVLLDAIEEYGIDADDTAEYMHGLSFRWHVNNWLCCANSGLRSNCSAVKHLLSVLQ